MMVVFVRPNVDIKGVLKSYLSGPAFYNSKLLFEGALGTKCFMVEYTPSSRWKKKNGEHSDVLFVVLSYDGREYVCEDVPPILIAENLIRDGVFLPKLRKEFLSFEDVLLWYGQNLGVTFLVSRVETRVSYNWEKGAEEIVSAKIHVSRARMRGVEHTVYLRGLGKEMLGYPFSFIINVVFEGAAEEEGTYRRVKKVELTVPS